jgi:membrane associated rhomboid family serine protease
MRQAAVGFQCPDCVREGSKSVRPTKAAYGGRTRRAPYVTYALIAVNVLMLVVQSSGGGNLLDGNPGGRVFQDLGLNPCTQVFVNGPCVGGVADGEYYRLFTAMFLHFGPIHLLLNMYSLWLLGPLLEQAFGQVRYAATYLLSGLGGSALSYALGPQNELAAGASGAVFGLFAAFYVLGRRRNLDVTAITATIGLNLVLSFTLSGIDWRGHVGGLLAGAALAWVIVYAPDRKERAAYQAAGVVVVAVLIVATVAVRTAQLA